MSAPVRPERPCAADAPQYPFVRHGVGAYRKRAAAPERTGTDGASGIGAAGFSAEGAVVPSRAAPYRRARSRTAAGRMGYFVELSVNGAVAGALYALAALSFVVVYKATRIMNFALGEFVMFAAALVAAGSTRWGSRSSSPWPSAARGCSRSRPGSTGSCSATSSGGRSSA